MKREFLLIIVLSFLFFSCRSVVQDNVKDCDSCSDLQLNTKVHPFFETIIKKPSKAIRGGIEVIGDDSNRYIYVVNKKDWGREIAIVSVGDKMVQLDKDEAKAFTSLNGETFIHLLFQEKRSSEYLNESILQILNYYLKLAHKRAGKNFSANPSDAYEENRVSLPLVMTRLFYHRVQSLKLRTCYKALVAEKNWIQSWILGRSCKVIHNSYLKSALKMHNTLILFTRYIYAKSVLEQNSIMYIRGKKTKRWINALVKRVDLKKKNAAGFMASVSRWASVKEISDKKLKKIFAEVKKGADIAGGILILICGGLLLWLAIKVLLKVFRIINKIFKYLINRFCAYSSKRTEKKQRIAKRLQEEEELREMLKDLESDKHRLDKDAQERLGEIGQMNQLEMRRLPSDDFDSLYQWAQRKCQKIQGQKDKEHAQEETEKENHQKALVAYGEFCPAFEQQDERLNGLLSEAGKRLKTAQQQKEEDQDLDISAIEQRKEELEKLRERLSALKSEAEKKINHTEKTLTSGRRLNRTLQKIADDLNSFMHQV